LYEEFLATEGTDVKVLCLLAFSLNPVNAQFSRCIPAEKTTPTPKQESPPPLTGGFRGTVKEKRFHYFPFLLKIVTHLLTQIRYPVMLTKQEKWISQQVLFYLHCFTYSG
jgi:hypothetical protein